MSKRKSLELCIYCNERKSTRKGDHVPPKLLFPDPKPTDNDLITVPSCLKCNQSFQKDDEYFILDITSSEDVKENSAAMEVNSKLIRSLRRKEAAGFRKTFTGRIVHIPVYSPNGLFLGYKPGYRYDDKRFGFFFYRLVRGLFFYRFNKRLDDAYGVQSYPVRFLDEDDRRTLLQGIGPVFRVDPERDWPGIFHYKVKEAQDEEFVTAWVFRFFEALEFVCVTLPKEILDRKERQEEFLI